MLSNLSLRELNKSNLRHKQLYFSLSKVLSNLFCHNYVLSLQIYKMAVEYDSLADVKPVFIYKSNQRME